MLHQPNDTPTFKAYTLHLVNKVPVGKMPFAVILRANTVLLLSSLGLTGDIFITRAAIPHLHETPSFKTNALHLASMTFAVIWTANTALPNSSLAVDGNAFHN